MNEPGGAKPRSVATVIAGRLARDGWWSFDRFMAAALYEPGLGYYTRGTPVFGAGPASGSDFVTAPELSPLFGATLAVAVDEALQASDSTEVWEFGAGSGALAAQLLGALPDTVRYHVVELSGTLAARQRERLAPFGTRVSWHAAWPEAIRGVVVGNEVLDAMPVQLLHFDGEAWFERGVALDAEAPATAPRFVWADRPTALRPPAPGPFVPGTVTEIHPQAEAFVRTLAGRLAHGAAFFVDYGFPEHEYYHPQRAGGTLMCHRLHRADADPLAEVGEKDITAHVNWSGIALAAQDAGLSVIGYTSQARFLMNCGLLQRLAGADPRTLAAAQKLLAEHEMGELFKVMGFATPGLALDPIGFATGDRTHTL